MPRPPIQHHRFFIEIEPNTQDFLNEQIDKALGIQAAGKAIEAVGRAASHPVGFLVVSAAITAILVKLGFAKNEIAAVHEQFNNGIAIWAQEGTEAVESARFQMNRAWCRFRTALMRPTFASEADYQLALGRCGGTPIDYEPRADELEEINRRLRQAEEKRQREMQEEVEKLTEGGPGGF